jgi:hypothetical protein
VIGLRRLGLAAAAAVFACVAAPAAMSAEVPPDVLDSYEIAIAPQSDGTLAIDYTLTGYHPMSEWPSDQPYLQVGIPNGYFKISSWKAGGANVSSVTPLTGSPSLAQFNFSSLPRVGDSFDLRFSVSVGHMAFSNGSETSFEFIPSGWTFPITVKRMTVSWQNPSGATPLLTQPDPTTTGGAMTWTWDTPKADGSGMFRGNTISIAYPTSVFSISGDTVVPDNGPTYDNSGSSSGSGWDPFGVIVTIIAILGALLGAEPASVAATVAV